VTTPPTSPDDDGPDVPDAEAPHPDDATDVDGVEPDDTEGGRTRRHVSRSTLTLILSCTLLVVFIVVAATRPVPYVTLGPGPTFNTIGEYDGKPLISVKGAKTYPTSGNLDLTTVSESGGPYGDIGLGEAIRGWLDPHVAVVPTRLLHPPGTSSDEVEKRNAADFSDAEDSATVAAFNYLKIPFDYVIKVSSVDKGSAADGKLKVGDVVVAVDGKKVSTVDAARAPILSTKAGDTVTMTIRRDGKESDVVLTPQSKTEGGKTTQVVGITLGDDYESKVTVTYSLTGVGGPSAGLMFSLGLVDMLSPTSINGGKYVAGTGTIDASGKVGPIGGIQQKLVGARDNGATIFLVPADNCASAKNAVPDGLTIAKVTTLTSAVDALAAINAGKPAPAC
jgi:PDZ domain-containing protein